MLRSAEERRSARARPPFAAPSPESVLAASVLSPRTAFFMGNEYVPVQAYPCTSKQRRANHTLLGRFYTAATPEA
jgi:hypothetical protein